MGADSPYGYSVWGLDAATAAVASAGGAGWVRYQRDWKDIEPSPGAFRWNELDAVVRTANGAGLRLSFVLQDAPDWARTQCCDGRPLFPGPAQMSAYAGAVAARYNGRNGHGTIDALEVGNEEYDNYWGGGWAPSLPCREPTFYGPVLEAAHGAIRRAGSRAAVGFQGMWWLDLPHIRHFYDWALAHGHGRHFDFANFHYYVCGADPATASPSFAQVWQAIHAVLQAHGEGAKPIWLTEFGWPISGVNQNPKCVVSPERQAQHLQYVLEQARASGVVRRVFWYTIGMGRDGMSLTQDGRPLPAYDALKAFAARYPAW